MFLRLISSILSHLFLLDSYRCAWVICGNISSFIPRYAHLVDMGLTVNGSKSGTPQSIPICILKMIKQLQNTTKTQWPMAFTSYPPRSAVNHPKPSNRARGATRRAFSSSCLAGRGDATAAVPDRQKEPCDACDLQDIMHQVVVDPG